MASKRENAQQALAKTQGGGKIATFRRMVHSQQKAIAAALPRHMDPLRMMRVIVTAAERNPRLLECSQQSLMKAIVECSQLGLEPDGVRGHAHLVPYKVQGSYVCQLQLGYQGMIELALRSGLIASVHAEVVYEGEQFIWREGTDACLEHHPSLDLPADAKVRCAYAVAKLKGGGTVHAVLRLRDIEKRRAASKTTRSDSPWHTHYEAMCRKSAIRELSKFLPQSPELQHAAVVDEAREERPDAVEADFELMLPADGEPEKPTRGEEADVDPETGEVLPPEREPGQEG